MYTMNLSHSTAFFLTQAHRQIALSCRAALFAIFILLLSLQTKAQQSDVAVEANIIYHFTKYINWPEDKKAGDFVIGIIGNTPLFEALKNSIVNKTAGSQKIIIKKFTTDAP